ncbi:MAG: endolytic transglycosylase MltG [Bdellovibrionales bacterium]|nr:endolytic transglycosylase MltG [Bdellovibrionales bacterium]
MKKFLTFLFLSIVLLVGLIATPYVGYLALLNWEKRPLHLLQPIEVDVAPGVSLRLLSAELQTVGLVDSALLFQIWVKVREDYSKFKAGHYRFDNVVTPEILARDFRDGNVYEPVVAQVTIPEGWSYAAIARKAQDVQIGDPSEFSTWFSDPVLIAELKVPAKTLEGYLFPATYSFTEIPTSRDFIETCVQAFWDKLPEKYEQNVAKLGLSLHDAVTFASLIELETPHDDERSAVAEVIWNRLKNKVALGIDASLIYGIENFDGNIRRSHLDDRDNPYNTRLHRGLPPGPIGSPSLKSLNALLEPTQEGYFYYVLDPSTGNRHHFSKSLKEHNKYVQKLIAHQRNLKRVGAAQQ